ncbi:MAG: hypothetical protein ACK42I_03145 [Thermomicrobium sp.]
MSTAVAFKLAQRLTALITLGWACWLAEWCGWLLAAPAWVRPAGAWPGWLLTFVSGLLALLAATIATLLWQGAPRAVLRMTAVALAALGVSAPVSLWLWRFLWSGHLLWLGPLPTVGLPPGTTELALVFGTVVLLLAHHMMSRCTSCDQCHG